MFTVLRQMLWSSRLDLLLILHKQRTLSQLNAGVRFTRCVFEKWGWGTSEPLWSHASRCWHVCRTLLPLAFSKGAGGSYVLREEVVPCWMQARQQFLQFGVACHLEQCIVLEQCRNETLVEFLCSVKDILSYCIWKLQDGGKLIE